MLNPCVCERPLTLSYVDKRKKGMTKRCGKREPVTLTSGSECAYKTELGLRTMMSDDLIILYIS